MPHHIGIDLGTTNSLVATFREGGAVVLTNELGDFMTPSAVAVAEDGELLVGRAAKDRLVVAPDSGIAFFKRDMGTEKTYRFGGRLWSPVECSAVVLNELKRVAEAGLGGKVDSAVISVPAYFRDEQRRATIGAAEIAGLKVDRLINEPTAAALAHGYRNEEEERVIFVFDLGGGTFDVTLLEVFENVISVTASGGVSRLGGEDFTDALRDKIIEQHNFEIPPEKSGHFRQLVEGLKRRLTLQEIANLTFQGEEKTVTRADFLEASKELSARMRPVIRRCLRDGGLTPDEVSDVLLVGGASRMPAIVSLVAEEFGRIPNQSQDPDRAIVLGAAVQAALIAGDESAKDLVLTDVCPHTLGVEVSVRLHGNRIEEGYFDPIIDRNTTVPASLSKIYQTMHERQNEIMLAIYQGEGRMVEQNRKIGQVHITGLLPKPGQRFPGMVEVRFSYDMNGMLEVEATVLESKMKFSKVFSSSARQLSDREISEAMARLAPLKIHPRDKLPNRARIERANRLFEDLRGEARERLSHLVTQFEIQLESQDSEVIQIAATMLDQFMDPYFRHEDSN